MTTLTESQRETLSKGKFYAARNGLGFKYCGNGHVQIIGKVIVNWYPFAKVPSAYVANTKGKQLRPDFDQVLAWANNPPAIGHHSQLSANKRRRLRHRIWETHRTGNTVKCHYCQRDLDRTEFTLDHVVPRSKGGADSVNNLVPSCVKCNSEKGNEMPKEKA